VTGNVEKLTRTAMRRRDTLKAVVGMGLWVPTVLKSAEADQEAIDAPPQENDLLVFAYGDREGQTIASESIAIHAPQTFAYPMDPATRIVRNGSRLNQILLVRLGPDQLKNDTRLRSVENIVAYSAVCSHTGCDVTGWDDESHRFKCPCHDSQFDPADGARVIGGPAPWQLASLPLKLVDGKLAVVGAFVGRVGFQQPSSDPFGT